MQFIWPKTNLYLKNVNAIFDQFGGAQIIKRTCLIGFFLELFRAYLQALGDPIYLYDRSLQTSNHVSCSAMSIAKKRRIMNFRSRTLHSKNIKESCKMFKLNKLFRKLAFYSYKKQSQVHNYQSIKKDHCNPSFLKLLKLSSLI